MGVLVLILYLNRTYAYFYDYIGVNLMFPPSFPKNLTVGEASAQTLKYTALGDSLSAGVGVSNYRETLPYHISVKLAKNKKVQISNLAKSGVGIREVLASQAPRAVILKPDILTILIGTNDIHNFTPLDEFEKDYRKTVSLLKEKTAARITVINIPYLGSDTLLPPYDTMLDLRTKQYNSVIEKIARQYDVKYIDLYTLSYADFKTDKSLYSPDKFHPSAKGYAFWGKIINAD